jgi:hypothetical protein
MISISRHLTSSMSHFFFLFAMLLLILNPSDCTGQILLQEDFESPNFPEGWTQQTLSSDGGYLLGTASSLESEYWSIADHGNIIATNDDECDCDKSGDYLIMPPFDFTNSSLVVLQFQNYYDGGSLFGGTEVANIEYSLDNGDSWDVLEEIEGTEDGEWDTQSIDLSSLAGNDNVLVAFRYNDDGEWLFGWAIDDVMVFSPEGLDAALVSLSVPTLVDAPTSLEIEGMVFNSGLDEINSFDVSWNTGGTEYNATFEGLAIASLESYNFSHPDMLVVNQSGGLNLQVEISNVNGIGDDNDTNDTIEMTFRLLSLGHLKMAASPVITSTITRAQLRQTAHWFLYVMVIPAQPKE